MNEQTKKIRTLKGVVVSDKMQKTVVVAVTRLKKHPKYQKYFKVTKKFKAHDPADQYHVGDKVLIQETRPLSKDKRWLVAGKSEARSTKSETNPNV
jgi:small subunit ribosomal protein S17